jgi:hypothetical protein
MGDSMSTIINATTTNGVVIQPDNSGSLVLQTNSGTTALTIDTSQNVGIGTASPLGKLNVSSASFGGTVSSNGNQIVVENSGNAGITIASGASSAGNIFFADSGDTADGYVQYDQSGRSMRFGTATAERMRIDSSGNVLVGTTSTSSSTRGWKTLNSGSNTIIGENDTGNVDAFEFYRGTAGSLVRVGNIRTNGTNTTYTTSSDYRLKDNIAPIIGALDKVALLKPVTYTWKQDGSDGQGFIAHELQEVIPDCVTGEKDDVETYTDEDGIEQTRIKPQGIDTSFLVATLTAAIQEMKAIIDAQSARIDALENK